MVLQWFINIILYYFFSCFYLFIFHLGAFAVRYSEMDEDTEDQPQPEVEQDHDSGSDLQGGPPFTQVQD